MNQKLSAKRTEYIHMEQTFMNEQAGIMATKLEEESRVLYVVLWSIRTRQNLQRTHHLRSR